ncbi:hypothetical protein BS17DRAFT_769963 [Gyrodon lividus]|nr:hypothetical protein BS17DRAFT_769963 [Gyrodon lividus]
MTVVSSNQESIDPGDPRYVNLLGFLVSCGQKSLCTKGVKLNVAAPPLTANDGKVDKDNQNNAKATNNMEPTNGEVDHGDNKQSPVPDVDVGDKGEEYEGDNFNDHHQWEQMSFDGTSCGKHAADYQAGDNVEMGSVREWNISPFPTPPPTLEKTAWYQAKIDYTMQDMELDSRQETCDIEYTDAEVAHIWNQEAKKLNIKLLEKEAENLCIKIQLAGLTCTNDLPA